MDLWRVSFDRTTGGHTHETAKGFGHALLVPMVTNVFCAIGVSASVYDGTYWWPIHVEPGVGGFELEHGDEADRAAYNARNLDKAVGARRAVRAEHAGYADLFVPILVGGRAVAVVVSGPFTTRRKTAPEILERWRRLTGCQGHPEDPEFSAYLRAALSMPVLEGKNELAFARLLSLVAALFSGQGLAGELGNRIEELHLLLRKGRFVERTWEAVRTMLDDRFPRTWSGLARVADLRYLGLLRAPDHVLVGLALDRASPSEPVDEILRRDAFQRASVELAHRLGNVAAGKTGDHGVVFLSAAGGSSARKRQKLFDLADHAAVLARRRFGLSLHFGARVTEATVPLTLSYQAALGAAETALARRANLVFAESEASHVSDSLRHLRHELGRAGQERPELLRARFERYLEGVAVQCGHRVDLARVHLEIGLERLLEPLVRSGGIDERSVASMRDKVDRASQSVRTMTELVTAYRDAMVDVSEAAARPVAARRDRSLRRALDHIHQHYTEPLRADKVATIAGFAPNYFSRLFKKRENKTFEQYVGGLRLERAKQLLGGSELDVARVAGLSGFTSSQYLARVFRRTLHMTPLEYRRSAPGSPLVYRRKARNLGPLRK